MTAADLYQCFAAGLAVGGTIAATTTIIFVSRHYRRILNEKEQWTHYWQQRDQRQHRQRLMMQAKDRRF